MKCFRSIVFAIIGIPFVSVSLVYGNDLTDPYEILERHYSALGGIERLKNEQTSYLEADIVLVGTGLEGKLQQWSKSPVPLCQQNRLRQPEDFILSS